MLMSATFYGEGAAPPPPKQVHTHTHTACNQDMQVKLDGGLVSVK